MGDLLNDPFYGEQFANTRLSELVIPGTHDSATYEILGAAIASPAVDISGSLGILLGYLDLTAPLEDFASAQSTTVGQQLADGVRSLDIRLYRDLGDGEVYGYHTWKAAPAQDVLDDLADFLTTPGNENELVLVQLSHEDDLPGTAAFLEALYDHPDPYGGTLGDLMIPKVVGDPDHQFEYNATWPTNEVFPMSDPTLEQALENGQLIVSFNGFTVVDLVDGNHFTPGYETTIPEVLWYSAARTKDLFRVNGGVYPDWEDVESEPKLFAQMFLAANNGFDYGGSYWGPLGLNSGINVADVLDVFDFDVPTSLEQYAGQMNWNSIPQIAGLPRQSVNVVEVDHYRPEYTEEFIKLNKGVYSVHVTPGVDALQTTYDAGGIFEGDPEYFPRYIFGDSADVWDGTYWTSTDYFDSYTYTIGGYSLYAERYDKDEGGGPLTWVSSMNPTAVEIDGMWDFRRSIEVSSSDPANVVVTYYEDDTDLFSYGWDPVAAENATWSFKTDLRPTFEQFVYLPGTAAGYFYTSGNDTFANTHDYLSSYDTYAVDAALEFAGCEWGIDCPLDEAITVEANGAYEVASGGTVDLSSRGSVYPSSRLRLKWDMDDGGPLVPDSIASSEPARFSAAGLLGNQWIEIRLLAVRSVIDWGLLPPPDDPLAEDTAIVYVCTDWDEDGLFDGAAGANQDPEIIVFVDWFGDFLPYCANDDDDDDNDGVADLDDSAPTDPTVCQDLDLDGCDDCSVGVDGVGPLADYDIFNDGPDADGDGTCDLSDLCFGDNATGDSDSDGFCDSDDLCAGDDASGDSDSDGVCDSDDLCEGDDASGDSDSDGLCDDSETEEPGGEDGGLDVGQDTDKEASNCGCSSTPTAPSLGWAILLLAGVVRRRG